MGAAGELVSMVRAYAGKRYPPFLYSGGSARGHLPVFCFHDVTPETFERQLRYLRRNGYRSLDADAALRRLAGGRPDGREVVLTFDDGTANFREVARPLLREHGFDAVVYLVARRVGRPGFLSWDDCRELRAEGGVDFQSHSSSHAELIRELRIDGVWSRSAASGPWGPPGAPHEGPAATAPRLPRFPGASLFLAEEGWELPAPFWDACAGADAPDRYRALLERFRGDALRLDASSIEARMEADLRGAVETIEREVPGQRVRHFAFPWHLHSDRAWRALAATGHVTGAVGLEPAAGASFDPAGVTPVYRVNGDFVESLPGGGRRSFLSVTMGKVRRRIGRWTETGAR